jgi:hypothetical protein
MRRPRPEDRHDFSNGGEEHNAAKALGATHVPLPAPHKLPTTIAGARSGVSEA